MAPTIQKLPPEEWYPWATQTQTTAAIDWYTSASTAGFYTLHYHGYGDPKPEPKPLTKQARARMKMRETIAALAPQWCRAREPEREPLPFRDLLLDHKRRCFRRTPRRPGMSERLGRAGKAGE